MLRSLIFLALAFAFHTVPVAANDWKDCVSDGPDASIKGCTAFLARQGETAISRAHAFSNRGGAYQAKGELDRAIADYNQAIEIDPKFALAYIGRGDAYKDRGELDRAIADYNRALELDPKDADAYAGRGVTYEAKGDMDRAIVYYNRALELDPKFVLAYNGRGNAYRSKGELSRAIADYNRAIELDPDYVYAYINRAAAYEASGDLGNAHADRAKAAGLNPKNTGSLRQLHSVKFDNDDVKSASANLFHVVENKVAESAVTCDGTQGHVALQAEPRKQALHASSSGRYSRHLRRRLAQTIRARRSSRFAHRHQRFKQVRLSHHGSRTGRASMEGGFLPL